jgi:replicative DNA helicase
MPQNMLNHDARESIASERALLGAMLLDEETARHALELVRRDHFYSEAHRRIFRKMLELHRRSTMVDSVTI